MRAVAELNVSAFDTAVFMTTKAWLVSARASGSMMSSKLALREFTENLIAKTKRNRFRVCAADLIMFRKVAFSSSFLWLNSRVSHVTRTLVIRWSARFTRKM